MTTAKTKMEPVTDRPVPAGLSEQVARLVEQAQFEGIQLTGEGGLP